VLSLKVLILNIGDEKMANINDVAREARVSITTVSRVLNNSYPVNEKTRKKVKDAIEKLNYKPNAIARGLVNKKTNTIGIIVPTITNAFFPEVVKGIADQCKEKGYNIILSNSESNKIEEKKAIENFLERQVDGIIIIDPSIETIPAEFYSEINEKVPIVIVNKYFENDEIAFVFNNERDGAYEAARYLIDMGHRDILFVTGSTGYASRVKTEGFVQALKDSNIIVKKENILQSDFTSERTYKLFKDNIAYIRKYTAVFCANDLMAIGAIKALKSEGYKVPEDFSVIGFDDISICSMFEPEITTVSQNIYTLGEVSGKTILDLLEHKKVNTKQKLSTKLIIRESCKKLEG
jgi:LacI family transcriptional regulator